jgi:hypothetical protein
VRWTSSENNLGFRNANRESSRQINFIALISALNINTVSVCIVVIVDKTVQFMYDFISELSIFAPGLSARAPYAAPFGNHSQMHPKV